MLSHGIPPMIMAGILGHSLAIFMTTYAHLARLAHFARYELLAILAALEIFQGLRMRQLA